MSISTGNTWIKNISSNPSSREGPLYCIYKFPKIYRLTLRTNSWKITEMQAIWNEASNHYRFRNLVTTTKSISIRISNDMRPFASCLREESIFDHPSSGKDSSLRPHVIHKVNY